MGVKSGDKVLSLRVIHVCFVFSMNLVSFLFCFLHESCIFTHLFDQVLLPEYGGMQVKIDDKELFMFRQTRALFVGLFLERCHVTPRCRDDEILGVLKSE
jgi:hypothetical protein